MPQVNITFFYQTPSRARVQELCLSVILAARHYDVEVHTNLENLTELGLPCSYQFRHYENLRPWSRFKLETFALAGLFPFIHIDSDVFLSEPLPAKLLKAPVFAQSEDPRTRYTGIESMPESWRREFAPTVDSPFAYNCGIIGGTPDLIREYAEFSIRACMADPSGMATFYEQSTLARFCHDRKIECAVLMNDENRVSPGYTHLMTGKDDPVITERIRMRIWSENRSIAQRLESASFGIEAPAVVETRTRVTADSVLKFYASKKRWRLLPMPKFELDAAALSNSALGIGDTVVITDLPRSASNVNKTGLIVSPSLHFPTLVKFNPWYRDRDHPVRISLCDAIARWDCGPGHTIQRAQRLFGLPVQAIPTGCIEVDVNKPRAIVPGRVSLHFEAGKVEWQRRNIHPRARMVYPDTLAAIVRFITEHPRMTFMEVGSKPHIAHRLPDRVQDATGDTLDSTIRMMAECEYHLGVNSGPMHIAAALRSKVIVIINFPHPGQVMLPNLLNTGVPDTEWIYPQSVVLHQDVDSPHWPVFSYDNLCRAFDGGVFPYWEDSMLLELGAAGLDHLLKPAPAPESMTGDFAQRLEFA